MKICFISPPFDLSGGQRVIAVYAQQLKRRGHEVVVVAPPPPRPGLRCTVKVIRRALLSGQGWFDWCQRPSSHLDDTDVERHVLDRFRPITDADVPDADVVVATWWETAEWVAALSPSKGVKVHFMQDYEVWGGPRMRVDATCRLPIPKIITAHWIGELLKSRFGVDDITLVPCGVDTELFTASPRSKQPTPTVGLNFTTFRNKGSDISLKAWELARREISDLRLVAFGSSRPSPQMPLPSDCEFFYRVPNPMLRTIYSQCDAWLFGSRIEGFGLPILEAMACRAPVIATPAGAAPELVARGGGYLVRPEDPGDMAAAIVRICRLPDLAWRALSDAAYATACDYTWEDATDRYEAALQAALGRASSE